MAKLAKFLQGVAGAAGGEALNVEDVFSTYLYEGNSSTQTITNGIDLSGEGGLVWLKDREAANPHGLYDTERGGAKRLISSSTSAEITETGSNGVTFNSNGFTITGGANQSNGSAKDIASWTFRKAPKFFDVVTYTGDGTSSRQISHDLGTTVGMTVVKCTSNSQYWHVLHRSGNAAKTLYLNRTDAEVNDTYAWNSTHATSTHFTIGAGLNTSGRTYVAYLFAHNDGDGEFGPDGDADIIKCGSFTASAGTEVDLGFEPQWVIVKSATSAADWYMFDNIRGWGADQGSNDAWLSSNTNGAELNNTNSLGLTPTGFTSFNGGDQTYIYIAIRRGPMGIPESASEVFAIDTYDDTPLPTFESSFVTDMALYKHSTLSQDWKAVTRLLGATRLVPNATTAETGESDVTWDFMNGWYSNSGTASTVYSWMWKRAPNFFDVVAYTGDGAATQDINHNLGVSPEMIWVKRRNASGTQWPVWHSGNPNYSTYLNTNLGSYQTAGGLPNYVGQNVSSTTFRVSTDGSAGQSNGSGDTYIAYLFASLAGVSKVGSYTGNGSTQTIDCGFSSGARFVLIKGSSFADNWWVFDTERGIVSGDDPRLYLNTTGAEFSFDYIDPHSSGFTVNSFLSSNGQTYIFYAIA